MKTLLQVTKVSLLMVLLSFGASHAANYQEGKHYLPINPPVSPVVESEAKHEVVELFWYGCPHCFDFEPYIEKWQEETQADVNFIRVPAIFNRSWEQHARAFYALELMGDLEQAHGLLFDAIHNQGRTLRDVNSIGRFLGANGIDEAKFKESFNSFDVEVKIGQAKKLIQQYQITGVPSVVINGQYRTSASDAGGYQQVIDVIEKLTLEESE